MAEPRAEDLRGLLEAYLASTEAVRRTQEALHKQVSELSEELEHKNALLARRNRLAELGEMAAGVAHEIRNPLGGIRLYAGLLERDMAGDPERLALVRKLLGGVGQLDRIVRDMLDFTRQVVPERRRVALEEVLEQAVAAAMPPPAVRVVRRYEEGLSAVVDPHHVGRAAVNLLVNATEAMPEGGVLTVTARSSAAEGAVELLVEDTGPGIPPESLKRVFDPFFTTKAQGTGLGLAIVSRVAEAHGGAVEAENRPEGGARLILRLPAAPSELAAAPPGPQGARA